MAEAEGPGFFIYQKDAGPIQAGIIFESPESNLKQFLPVADRKNIGPRILETFQLINFFFELDVFFLKLDIKIIDLGDFLPQ